MAEDLAKAIVLASNAMHRRTEPKRVATISVGHFPDEDEGIDYNFDVRGTGTQGEGCPNHLFRYIEDAINKVQSKGFVRMNELEEKEWIDELKRSYSKIPGGPKDYKRGKPIMVFFKLIERKKDSGGSSNTKSKTGGEESGGSSNKRGGRRQRRRRRRGRS